MSVYNRVRTFVEYCDYCSSSLRELKFRPRRLRVVRIWTVRLLYFGTINSGTLVPGAVGYHPPLDGWLSLKFAWLVAQPYDLYTLRTINKIQPPKPIRTS